MSFNYQCDFNLQDCIKTLGVNERGRVQKVVSDEVKTLCDQYVPLDKGTLRASGHVENNDTVVWGKGESNPYAHYMWEGILYVDPVTKRPFSRPKVTKVPADPEKRLEYHNGSNRKDHWVERMLQDGGRDAIEKTARLEARK